MTQDEIIEMAEQAGMTQDGDMWFSFGKGDMDVEHEHIVAFAKLVAAKEREACAKVCESEWGKGYRDDGSGAWLAHDNAVYACAAAIRARGDA
jgi:hypothetical protein